MSYFADHYESVRFPIDRLGRPGLRRAQLGAIHALASHFTIRDEPAIVVMPTGSGKTAVLMMTAFLERAQRVLVLTPSRLVRNQIAEDFDVLLTAKKLNIVPRDLPTPKVQEIEGKVQETRDWQILRNFDVVVSTPNSISPALKDVPTPLEDLFDLLLIDEAHHSPANTWNAVIDSFPNAHRALFTATPFRMDQKEIIGQVVYNYPIRSAYEDKIFGQIEYVDVAAGPGDSSVDILVAQRAEEVLREDKENGLDHFLMVRTDRRTRAKELQKIYEENTDLSLGIIHSSQSYKHIKQTVKRLRQGKLEGIICVAMLGEGFDLPNLKVAAIHQPHKSLGVTLQFIGRFARTGSTRIGKARFVAARSDIEIETEKLYSEGAIWQEIIANLSHSRIKREMQVREALQRFEPPLQSTYGTEDLSLYSLRPNHHVKIYLTVNPVNLTHSINLPREFELVFQQVSRELSAAVFISREVVKPRWTDIERFYRIEHDLFVVYYSPKAKLLFINSSRTRNIALYEALAREFTGGGHRILSLKRINQVLSGLRNADFFNIGMRNRQATNSGESYRIITGSSAQAVLTPSDGQMYHRGHVFGRAEDEEQKEVFIGYSSASKVWSHKKSQIPFFLEWCKDLAKKLSAKSVFVQRSALDILSVGDDVTSIPNGLLGVEWDQSVYQQDMQVEYVQRNGTVCRCSLLDLELDIDWERTSKEQIGLVISGEGLVWFVDYSPRELPLFRPLATALSDDSPTLVAGQERSTLLEFFNSDPPVFCFGNGTTISGGTIFPCPTYAQLSPFDRNRVKVLDWSGVEITREVEKRPGNLLSIHEHIARVLIGSSSNVVLYDHRPGEIADFVTFEKDQNEITLRFLHCKGSKTVLPGDRTDAVNELCAQVIKSLVWATTSSRKLALRIDYRLRSGSKLLKGSTHDLGVALKDLYAIRTRNIIVVVQPGISKEKLSERNLLQLAAADEFLKRNRTEYLEVWASA